jgi:REP element-mobilizing transposase RayT
MAKARKTHEQQELWFGDKNGQNRGRRKTKRRGKKRGPKPKGERPSSPHTVRPTLKASEPVHVVLRVHKDVGNMRKRHMYTAFHAATIAVALHEWSYDTKNAFRIVHISIQTNHVHLIVEAADKKALSRGMQSFQISAAKHINRAYSARMGLTTRRRGSVFPDRYHQEIIRSPRQARHALSYVLNNWRKHGQDRVNETARGWKIDLFSTAGTFWGWKGCERADGLWGWRDGYEPLAVYVPKTWLLREGWMKHGRIGFDEVPSTPRASRN